MIGSNPNLVAAATLMIVMGVMALLTGLVALFRCAARVAQRRALGAARPEDEAESRDEELLAVLAAAATFALGSPVRIHRVHLHPERRADVWVRAARLGLQASHHVVPKR